MKTTLNPFDKDLADARGTDSRAERDDPLRPAGAKTCHTQHTLGECSGTETLAKIEQALQRLASGTYGICLSCGADISLGRLDANPAIETCGSCSEKVAFKAH